MADQVKEFFHKTFTDSEIANGATYTFTTDANTGAVIKDIKSQQSAASPIKITATAKIGLTSDYNATPSKSMDLGVISSDTVSGVTGSEIMDASSTFAITIPATTIAYNDIVHNKVAYTNNGSITQVESVTPTINGESEAKLATTKTTITNVGSNFVGYNSGNITSNSWNFRQFVTNPHQNINLALLYTNDTNSTHILRVSEQNSNTNYQNQSLGYTGVDFDGRFVYVIENNQRMRVYDTMGDATRPLTNYPHLTLEFYNASGNNLPMITSPTTYPKYRLNYLSDVKKTYHVIAPGYQQGIYIYENPTYDMSDGTALAAVGGVNARTTGYWQAQSGGWHTQSSAGPNSNRANPAYVQTQYTNNNARASWMIGSSAASTTKRILIYQDGSSSYTSNRLFFFIADFNTMLQDQNNNSSNLAYGATEGDLLSEFGWATGSYWQNMSGLVGYVQGNQFYNLTGSFAQWDCRSSFHLDQDVLTFTNTATAGTGEGPIISWNLKTNTVTAPITWAEYTQAGGTALNNPASSDAMMGHKSFARAPTTTQINARTYTKKPSLSIRATGIQENR